MTVSPMDYKAYMISCGFGALCRTSCVLDRVHINLYSCAHSAIP